MVLTSVVLAEEMSVEQVVEEVEGYWLLAEVVVIDVSAPVSTVDVPFASGSAAVVVVVDAVVAVAAGSAVVVVGSVGIVVVEMAEVVVLLD